SIALLILRLYFDRRLVVQRYRAPAKGFDILHRVFEQLAVGQTIRHFTGIEIPWFLVFRNRRFHSVRKLKPALFHPLFKNCEGFVHRFVAPLSRAHIRSAYSLNLFVIGIRRSRPKARGVIFTPGAAWRRLYSFVSTIRMT